MRVTQKELADVFGVSPRTIRSWASEKGLPAPSSGMYDLGAAVAWRVGRARAEGVDAGRRMSLEAEVADVERRKQLALARKYEADVAVKLGQLVDMGEAIDLFENVLSRVRAQMVAITGRLIPLLTRYEPSEALQVVEPVVRDAMEAASMAAAEGDEDE